LFTLLPLPPLAGAQFLQALGVRLPAAAGMLVGFGLFVMSALGITRTLLLPLFRVLEPLVLGPGFTR